MAKAKLKEKEVDQLTVLTDCIVSLFKKTSKAGMPEEQVEVLLMFLVGEKMFECNQVNFKSVMKYLNGLKKKKKKAGK